MTVLGLKTFLETCDPTAAVTITVPEGDFDVVYGIDKVSEETVNAAMEVYDDPWYVDVVRIKVRK